MTPVNSQQLIETSDQFNRIIELEDQLRIANETITTLKKNCAQQDVRLELLKSKLEKMEKDMVKHISNNEINKSTLSVRKFNARL